MTPGHARAARALAFLAVVSLQASPAFAALPPGFVLQDVASPLSRPTAMAFAPDGRLFIADQDGAVRVVKAGALLATAFLTLTVDASGERGLLGIAFDPAFGTNGFVYVYYTVPSTPPHNRVSRFTASGDAAVAGSEVILVELDGLSIATNHNGGAIHFGPDGKLYVAVGENANSSNAQTLANRLGKVLRVNADGTIPGDNPFPAATGANRAIWAVGLRNPFTFSFQPGTGRMFVNDVGQGAFEEVNDGIAGSNYGWPIYEGPAAPPNPSFRDPIFTYLHIGGTPTGCAIVGSAFYNPGTATFPAAYVGKYFFADLCVGFVRYLDPTAPAVSTDFATGFSSPVDLATGPDGALYVLERGGSTGALRRIQYAVPVELMGFFAE